MAVLGAIPGLPLQVESLMGVMLCFFQTRLKVIQLRLARDHYEKRRKNRYRVDLPDVPAVAVETPCTLPARKPEYG